MQIIDELIPLTPEEIKLLEAKRFSSNTGCGVFAAIVFLATVFLAVGLFRGKEYIWMSVAVVFALLCLLITIYLFWTKQTEDKNVTLDLAEGKNAASSPQSRARRLSSSARTARSSNRRSRLNTSVLPTTRLCSI